MRRPGACREVADPAEHTSVKDPNEPLQFSFPDLNGHIVSNSDSRFRGKVLVIDVAGSWCPNCHDEAPFLQALYRKYHRRGLEVVTLSFEEPEQFANPVRLRAFVKDFGSSTRCYWPARSMTCMPSCRRRWIWMPTRRRSFIGRDGLVKGVHAGFAAAATGDFNIQLRMDFTATIERLLAQKSR
jgi:thiol-disulfide isomerase/thioredoxin